jgi:hypothetical protein
MQPARQLAQLGEHRAQVLDAALKRRRGGRLGRPRRELQRQRKRDQTLLGAVVEVALDPPSGVVGGGDDPRARLLELDPRIDVGDRLRDQLGECAEARFRLGAERLAVGTHRERAPQTAIHEGRHTAQRLLLLQTGTQGAL